MAGSEARVVEHYASAGLAERILAALEASGVPRGAVTTAHLAAVDEFHIGGNEATVGLLDQLVLRPGARVLDIGCGIGGAARLLAERYGAEVTGLDLTPEFVEAARRLTEAVGLKARFVTGSAVELPFAPASFEAATLLHVGMNLADKPRLFAEAARVLVPGGSFGVFEVMRFGAHPDFPLPWADTPEISFLEPPGTYLDAARDAGFELVARRDRGEIARAFFVRMRAAMAEGRRPAVGLPMLMGAEAGAKVANMVAAIDAGDIEPVEMIFRKTTGGRNG
jgi:SAM-dependent methyltransferase